MNKNFSRIAAGLVLVIALVLLYSTAVTQTAGSKKGKTISPVAHTDTADIEGPTQDDPWAEFDNLVKTYYAKNGMLYQGTMKVIDGNGDSDKVLEEKKFEYTCFNDEYSYSLSPLEVVSKKNFTVIVNHDDKMIAVASKVTREKRSKDLLSLDAFREMIEQQKANIKVTKLGDEKILTVDGILDPQIQGYRIFYSPGTYKIHKMLIGMLRLSPLDTDSGKNDNQQDNKEEKNLVDAGNAQAYVYYLEIDYSAAKQLSLQRGDFNPEKRFVNIEGKNISLTPEFKGYELFNSEKP